MPYLNVDEVESALTVASSAPFAGFTQLITLPHLTWEGRQCHAIKIANGSGPGRPGVYFLGGIHSREWGSSDILINFVEQLEQAYQGGTGLTFGARSFSATDIQTIVDTLDIVVFPQANPDGRHYSMNTEALWRKNRRQQAPNSAACTGVDVNRNYDFLWDFPTYFSPSVAIVDSTDPCDYQLYHGPSAFSEPESLNARWIFDTFPNVGYFIDLHSYGEDILYSWGDDEDQTTDPSMNFQNPAYNGRRGIGGDTAYKEYIPSSDLYASLDLANTMRGAIQAVRGTNYTVKSGFALYPTAGTSDDYAYSRSFVDPGKAKVIAYTLEWGAEFQPPYSEMQNIIQEITAGLLAFCFWVRSTQACTFIIERSTLGQDEIDARRTLSGSAVILDAFRVVVDGFTASALGITGPSSVLNVASPSGGMTISCTGNIAANGDYGPEVQRFTFLYNIDFGPTDAAFNFAGPTELLTLNAAIASVSASAQIELIKQPDPFILHGDPTWLSVDLRVFVVRAGETKFGVTMVNDASAAPGFIQQVMAALTAGGGTAGPDSFDGLSTGEAASSLYVYPTDSGGRKVFNFALAKVHYIGLIGATNVRVFFRLFQAQSTSTAFDPSTTYRTAPTNPSGQKIALAGIQGGEYVTIPCFAMPRVDSTVVNMTQQIDDPYNVQTFTAVGGPEVDHYYGCWLDINQPNNVLPILVPPTNVDGPFPSGPFLPFNPLPIQQAILRNPHQCLVAEISFDPVAIPAGKDPSNWDKLAQRNLAWSDIPNPGANDSRRALSTFEIRPTPAGQTPDELMIDWGSTPAGSMATIYLPAVNVSDILELAARMDASHRLERADDHTVRCRTGGITYIPIPAGAGINYAGLLSVDLPASVRKGQAFTVVIRQVTNAYAELPTPPSRVAARRAAGAQSASMVSTAQRIEWRRVLGAFQLTIPVHTKEVLRGPEERLLSVLRWIEEAIPPESRWFLVFRRYVRQVAGRVSGLGGDPGSIGPSPTGTLPSPEPGEPGGEDEDRLEFTGKIEGLVYDHFGDFEGFILETRDGEQHHFESREHEVLKLVRRAWAQRVVTSVVVHRSRSRVPRSIILRGSPPAFED